MKKSIYILSGFLLLLSACETIEDREALGPKLKANELVFSVKQPTPGSNTIILNSNTPKALAYWDWESGSSNKANDTIYIPFSGTIKMKYSAFSAGGPVTDSVMVTITNKDEAFLSADKAWYALTNGGAGQTWVWATDFPTGNIAGNGPEDCLVPTWWQMSASGYDQSPRPLTDEIYMDLDGAAHFRWKKPDGSVVKGFFEVITPFTNNGKTFSSIEVLRGPTFPWPRTGKYHFTKMTNDELAVHAYKGFEISMFKRKGFNY